jgi:capsular exopolysaccharide synthesis family protein
MAKKSKLVKLFGVVEKSNVIESFEKLQVNIGLASVDKKIQIIQVTSSLQDEGKTTVAVNLAYSYALKGEKVLVVDLDIRRPKIHRNFNQPNENGIVDFAAGNTTKEQLVKHTDYGVDVILTGSKTPYPVKILESELIKNLIEEARGIYDYIILDTPPVGAVVDPIVISKLADAVVFIVQADRTKKAIIKDSIKQLELAGANIIGLVATNVKQKYANYKYKYYVNEESNIQ